MCATVQLARREREKPLYVILLCTGSVRNAASCLFACAALRCCVQSGQQRLNLLGDTHTLTELLGGVCRRFTRADIFSGSCILLGSSVRTPNRKDDPKTVEECDEVAKQAKQGQHGNPEQCGSAPNSHDDRRTDDEGCRHDSDRHAVDGVMQAFPEAIEALEVEVDPHAPVARILDQTGEVARHSGEKTKGVRQTRLAATQRHDGLIPFRESAVEEWPDTVDELKIGVILTAKPLKADQRLEHQREVGWQQNSVLP